MQSSMSEEERLITNIQKLHLFWQQQRIVGNTASINLASKPIPRHFRLMYEIVNGMEMKSTSGDNEGFLFYPSEHLCSVEDEFKETTLDKNITLFADYLTKCWWYGVRTIDDEHYEIGLVITESDFIFITNSLAEFIELYMSDDAKLYPGSISIDLNNAISEAVSQQRTWAVSDFFHAISLFENLKNVSCDWEEGENWATIATGKDPIAYLWQKYPLVIIAKNADRTIVAVATEQKIETVFVSSFTDFLVTLNPHYAATYFDLHESNGAISVEDLWFRSN